MEFKFDASSFLRKLDELQENLGTIDGREVPLIELFDPPFMAAHTQFQSLEDMFEDAGLHFNTQEGFESIDESVLDEMVKSSSEFQSWAEMKSAALPFWVRRHLHTDTSDDEEDE